MSKRENSCQENDPDEAHHTTKKAKVSLYRSWNHVKKENDKLTICSKVPESGQDERVISNIGLGEENDATASLSSCPRKDDIQVENKNDNDGFVETSRKIDDELPLKERNEELYTLFNDSSSEDEDIDDLIDLSELDELLEADLPLKYKKPISSSSINNLSEKKETQNDFELEKTMLSDISGDQFNSSPKDWIQGTDHAGIPIYHHQPSQENEKLTICSKDSENFQDEKGISQIGFREENDASALLSSCRRKDDIQVDIKNDDEGFVESIQKNDDELRYKEKNDDLSSSSNDSSSENENIDGSIELSELDELLDADLPSKYKKPVSSSFIQKLNEKRKTNGDFVELEKTMLDDISGDHFDLLPEGWIQMTHRTGIPVYLHRPSRVCTLARPYFLGSGNIFNHRIPLSAVPCLQYRQVMNKLARSKVEDCTRLIGNLRVPITKVETVYDNHRSQSLDASEIREYCQKLFVYKKVFIKRNESMKNKSNPKIVQNKNFKNRPSLPAGTKLLSFISFERDGKGEVIRRREWIMNPSGKSYIAILHEYLQQSLKIQPVYEFKDNETEYESTVKLNDVIFGRGVGLSKKEAKLQAAKQTIETLIPELNGKAEEICGINIKKASNPEALMDSNNIFDEIKITDPRIAEFCARTTEPSPYAMLLTCLRRNCGSVDVDTDYIVSSKHNKYNTFTMTVGKHTVSVSCRNKRDGKQKAAQSILQALHPQLKTWGSLVRLYGNKSVKNAKEKKLEEQEITQLQTQAKINSPNYAILNKLNEELEKLYKKKLQMDIKPVGTLITSDAPKNPAVHLNPLNYA